MNLETRFARFLSVVLHPLLIPTLGVIILFQLNTYLSYSLGPQAKRVILLIVFINSAIAPTLSILLLKRTGMIRDVLLDERSERMIPLMLSAVYFFITYYLLRRIALPSLLYFYLIGATILILLTLIITYRWKISIHMVSMGGLTGFLISLALLLQLNLDGLIIAAFFASGLLGTARVKLNAHNLSQVFAGYIMGIGVMLLLFLYLRS
ncbi:MAG: hypothetical protein RBS53_00385 [Bacteroidales bacterium]|jgi:membrane-associated phospholipid phosphatase|nr:hypothetical protein [Bacteroidales bacterium]NLM92482.1 hypothetical protein [Bacteroidales bacterium]